MAKPSKKLPDRTVKVFCTNCRTQLYKYAKGEPLPQRRCVCIYVIMVNLIPLASEGGKGSLVKTFHERILEDYTDGSLNCPECGQEFARETIIRGA